MMLQYSAHPCYSSIADEREMLVQSMHIKTIRANKIKPFAQPEGRVPFITSTS